MAIKAPDASQLVLMLIVGMVFLFLITSIIDFNAINSDDPDAKIFRENVNYEDKISQTFVWLVTGMGVYLAWIVVMRSGGAFNRKTLITLVVLGIVLYFLYNKVIAPQLDLAPIEFAAYQLQSVVG